jgi:hypothetical protein
MRLPSSAPDHMTAAEGRDGYGGGSHFPPLLSLFFGSLLRVVPPSPYPFTPSLTTSTPRDPAPLSTDGGDNSLLR